jgi:very-short-patch-repair endonuclease
MTPGTQTRPSGDGKVGVWRERERDLARLATRQHGVVARRQLLALGFGDEAIKLRLAAGRLKSLHLEVYAVGHWRIGQRGHWWAGLLAYGGGALLSHHSAATLWGLTRPRGSVVEVTAPTGRQGVERRERLWIHRGRLDFEDRHERAGIPVTSVARTLFDFAEVVDFERLEKAWEEADRLHLLQLRAVESMCERGYGRRALKPIRRLLAEARAATATRSPLEDRFQRFCDAHELPPRLTNVEVLGHEVDVLWPAARLIVELDSWEHHSHRAAFERDRARDPKLLLAGYRTLRVTHRRLDREAPALATEVHQLLNKEGILSTSGSASPPNPERPETHAGGSR